MKFLTRDEILAADDLPFKDIPVPEWGGMIRVRSLRGIDRANLMDAAKDAGKVDDWIERMIIACTCDESGEPIFQMSDLTELKKKNSKVLQNLFFVADELNGLSDKSRENTKGESEPIPK